MAALHQSQDSPAPPTAARILPAVLPYPADNQLLDEGVHRQAPRAYPLAVDLPQHHQTLLHKYDNQTGRQKGYDERDRETADHVIWFNNNGIPPFGATGLKLDRGYCTAV